ncbi:MAG: ABC transporter substrate-binding protein [Mycobacteriaceae bacterium]|uniref:ABC transporter substrate-binding protein n=1 Tax=Corynebacterium sp. TaxID=1720 RepID=UPI003F97935F
MNTRRILVAAIAASTLVLSLASCSPEDDPGDSQSSSTAASGSFPVTIEHARGTTEIPEAPERIIALDNAFLDYAVDLGGTVVGVSDIGADLVPSYLSDEQKDLAKDVEAVGDISEPELEKIASLEPDLILSSDVRHEAFYDQLEEIAPTVFSEKTGDEWEANFLLTGEALGKKDEAQQRLDDLDARAERIRERLDEPGNVSIVRIVDDNTIRLYGEETFSGSVLAKAGLPRPDNQEAGFPGQDYGMFVVSRENLEQAEADMVLVSVPEDGTAKATEFEAASKPVFDTATWKALDGEKIDVDEGTWMTSVSPVGADHILTDLAEIFGVDGD